MSPEDPSDPAPPPPTPDDRAPSGSAPGDLLDAVRAAAAGVAGRARFVHLVPDRLEPYARSLVSEGHLASASPPDVDHPDPWTRGGDDPETVAGRVLALATINFGSGWHPVVRKRLGPSGARNMANGLSAWLDDGGVAPERLARLESDEAHRVFDQPHDDGPVDELMALFTVALNDLGRLVCDHHDGSYLALVERSDGSAAALAESLGEMTFFHDVSTHQGHDVPLYKRAQLASADLHRAFGGEGPGRFHDLDRLTAFADNLVPHVLRLDGVLTYDDELVARIDAGELLVAGSPEEVEIRALGVHAVEGLRAALAGLGHDVPSWRLDELLWRRGAGPRYKAVPRHRARSVFY